MDTLTNYIGRAPQPHNPRHEVKTEVVEDLACSFGETADVMQQVISDLVRLTFEFLEVELAPVVEALLCYPIEDRVEFGLGVLLAFGVPRSAPAPLAWSAPVRNPAGAGPPAAASHRRTERACTGRAADRPRSR